MVIRRVGTVNVASGLVMTEPSCVLDTTPIPSEGIPDQTLLPAMTFRVKPHIASPEKCSISIHEALPTFDPTQSPVCNASGPLLSLPTVSLFSAQGAAVTRAPFVLVR